MIVLRLGRNTGIAAEFWRLRWPAGCAWLRSSSGC